MLVTPKKLVRALIRLRYRSCEITNHAALHNSCTSTTINVSLSTHGTAFSLSMSLTFHGGPRVHSGKPSSSGENPDSLAEKHERDHHNTV